MPKKNNQRNTQKFNLENLFEIAKERGKTGNPENSYTAYLLAEGPEKIAKKVVEEAFETALASVEGKNHKSDKKQVIMESADLLYHLFVLLIARKVELTEVVAELEKRAGTSGLEEKAKRKIHGKIKKK